MEGSLKLVNAQYGILLEFYENEAAVMVIESKPLRLSLVTELCRQCMGEDGSFVLSEDNEILKINKTADILLNPFSIDCSQKKILTKLYQQIDEIGNENYYEEKQRINSEIVALLDKVMLNLPYNISFKLETDLAELCRLYNVQLENSGETLLERLMDYIKVMSQLCGYKLFVLLNFSQYFCEEEMKQLYKFAAYQKVFLLRIEYAVSLYNLEERGCIIDEDGCIIVLENHSLQHLPNAVFGENLGEFEV